MDFILALVYTLLGTPSILGAFNRLSNASKGPLWGAFQMACKSLLKPSNKPVRGLREFQGAHGRTKRKPKRTSKP